MPARRSRRAPDAPAAWALDGKIPRMPPRNFTRLLVASVACLVVSGVIAVAQLNFSGTPPPPYGRPLSEFMAWYKAQPRMKIPEGAQGAAVLIVKFTDVECPGCGVTYEAHKPVLAKYEAQYPGAIRFVTKDYPLNKECNASMQGVMHPSACDAAVAIRLARRHGNADALESWLYANREVLTPESVRKAAALLADVSAAEFEAGYKTVVENVKADAALGALLGVNSTPTFFINGIRVPLVLEPARLEAAIDYELKRAGKIK